jgi:hypothetical protein
LIYHLGPGVHFLLAQGPACPKCSLGVPGPFYPTKSAYRRS